MMEGVDFNDALAALKQIAGAVMMSAIHENDVKKLALGNALSIGLAAYSIGGDIPMSVLKGLGPVSKEIAKKVEEGAPGTEDMQAVDPKRFIQDDGEVGLKDYIKEEMAIKDLLKDTGATISGLESGQEN